MGSVTQNPNPSPTPKSNPRNIYHIGGLQVEFPYKPYGSQLAFMGRVISTLDRGQKQGHCHALLESPTGTGKTLSLLCSALAWQQRCRSNNLYSNLSHSKAAPEAVTDPMGHGGGFVPEPSGNLALDNSEPVQSAKNSGKQKKKAAPIIFYASRTHSQITQAIREYRKTSYRVPMAVLASRKHYCTNKNVCGKDNVDEECKLLIKDRDIGCSEFKNVNKVKGHHSIQKGGCNEVHDIEDLVKVGQAVKGCSYFAARSMAEEAQLVFCPYSYIISPTIRKAMEVDLKDNIVILDEAHNIEDMARDAGGVDVDEEALLILKGELQQLCFGDSATYQPLYDMIEGILSWMVQRKGSLEKREFQHHFTCWSGDKALGELQEATVSQQFFPILQTCAAKAIKDASDVESGAACLTGMSLIALEGLITSLGYFFSGNGLHASDYLLVLQNYIKRDAGVSSGWTYSLSLWCMNPAVVFREIAALCMSVILTSGTLSPMATFSSELGVQFETRMEAPHVINVESQLWAAVVSTGPGNHPLNASYRTADAFNFQDALGTSLEEICKIVPGGALVFFPSYKLMEKLCTRWRQTGQWCRLNAQKPVFTEPRGNHEKFEQVLKDYYDSVRGVGPTTRKIKRGKRRDLKLVDVKDEVKQQSVIGGSAFLAVCRGKVSEGIDFSDENARVVVIVGIPFPNINDIKVAQKKKFNDMYKSSKNLLGGGDWYCQQAFRALNQAAGRCIRHRFDYGAIIFMDERFKEERNLAYVSKWLRSSIKQYNNFDMTLDGLRSFFQNVKASLGQVAVEVLKNTDVEESIPSAKSTKLTGERNRKNQKTSEQDHCSWPKPFKNEIEKTENEDSCSKCSISEINGIATLPKLYNRGYVGDFENPCTNGRYMENQAKFIDLEVEGSPKIDSRLSEITSMAYFNDRPDFVVEETSCMHDNVTMAGSVVLSNDEISSPTIVASSNELPDQVSLYSTPLKRSSGARCSDVPVLVVSPDRIVSETSNLKPGLTSSLNLSVNSHTEKRRKPICFPSSNNTRIDLTGNSVAKSPNGECMRRTNAAQDATCRVQFSSKSYEDECDYRNQNTPQVLIGNNLDKSCLSSDVVMDKNLHICCSLCKSSLGLSDNQFLVSCTFSSSSKDYLVSFLKSRSQDLSLNKSKSVSVVISDITSIDWRLLNGDTAEHGVWCETDGCVYRTVFCPFCTASESFLGLQILATDVQNTHLLLKILFFFDRLEIKSPEASIDQAVLPVSDLDCGQTNTGSDLVEVSCGSDLGHRPIDKSQCHNSSGGWRTTKSRKSKLRLPKRALLCDPED